LLFANRKLNDFVGRWFLGYPCFAPIDLYRRGHMAHHREEFGRTSRTSRCTPATRSSATPMRRKLTRDALGITGFKLMRGLFAAWRAPSGAVKRQAWSILGTQVVILGLFTLAGNPWLYLFLWLLPDLTVWRVMNRLRSIAEHGGMRASEDRRNHHAHVRQSWAARVDGRAVQHRLAPCAPRRLRDPVPEASGVPRRARSLGGTCSPRSSTGPIAPCGARSPPADAWAASP